MRAPALTLVLLVAALAVSGCGSKDKNTKVDTATYTCGQFSKSLNAKADNTAGAFINELRKQAKLGQDVKTERREVTLGIYFACRNQSASTHPAQVAVKTAKQIKAGTFKLPGAPKKKKSGK